MKTLKFKVSIVACLLFGALVFSFSSCTNEDESKLTDEQIASIAVVANKIDVEYGEIAREISNTPEIIRFAETMMKDHQDIISQAAALAEKLGVTPDDDNEITKSLLESAEAMKEKLKTLRGAEFDKAYAENEVNFHEAVIKAVKETLIPQTDNEELKELLVSVSPLLDHHLGMAKEVKEKIDNMPEIPELNDAQIASIVVVANQIDVDYGMIAKAKTQDETALKFAQTMIDDHTNIINAAVDLATKLGVVPDNDNPVTKSLLEGAEDIKAKLNSLEGEEFVVTYIENEVTYHDAVVAAVKDILLPQTENEDLKATIESVLPLLEHHLQMAKESYEAVKK